MTVLSFHGRCSYKEFQKWADTLDWMFDGDFYSEQDKMKIVACMFDDDAFAWWDDLKAHRHFYDERPINTWYDIKVVMRKQFRQNNYNEFFFHDHDISDHELRLGRIDQGLSELSAGMDNIMFLFPQLEKTYPNPNKVCSNNVETPRKEEILEIEHAEIPMVEESLTVSMENQKDEEAKSKELEHDSFAEEEEEEVCQHQSEVVFFFL